MGMRWREVVMGERWQGWCWVEWWGWVVGLGGGVGWRDWVAGF